MAVGNYSSNILVIFAIFIAKIYGVSQEILLCLLALLFLIVYINGSILIPGFYRLFLMQPRHISMTTNYSRISFFIQYIYCAYIKSFHKFNTIQLIFRYCTKCFRRFPDFYILGPKKCATNALAQHLLSLKIYHGPFSIWNNSEIQQKESFHFRGFLGLNQATISNYRLYWPLIGQSSIMSNSNIVKYFDADPSHLYLPHIRDRLYDCTPNAKFLIIVRNPIERALATYYHDLRLRIAFERKHPFLCRMPAFMNLREFLNIELFQSTQETIMKLKNLGIDEELPMNTNVVDRHSIIGSGKYTEMLLWYMERFPFENFLFINVEKDLQPSSIVDTLYDITVFIFGGMKNVISVERIRERINEQLNIGNFNSPSVNDENVMCQLRQEFPVTDCRKIIDQLWKCETVVQYDY